MRKYCCLLILILSAKFLSAQTLGVKWQKAFGGSNLEEGNLLRLTNQAECS